MGNRGSSFFIGSALLLSILATPTRYAGVAGKPAESGQTSQNATAGLKSGHKPSLLHHVNAQNKAYVEDYQTRLTEAIETACGSTKKQPVSRECTTSNFIIATVPDPVHTRLALSFDQFVEAIQQALAHEQYSFERALLPWDPRDHPESDEYEDRLQEEQYYRELEKLTGLMLFSKEKEASGEGPQQRQPMLVFLVAEAPTYGINKDQFSWAVDRIREYAPAASKKQHAKPLDLRILGPTFSGSLPSLATLLHGTAELKTALVYSGDVTSASAIEEFENQFEKPTDQPQVTFASFEESDEVAIERFIHFVSDNDHKYDPHCIALLSEDETPYGQVFAPAQITEQPNKTSQEPTRRSNKTECAINHPQADRKKNSSAKQDNVGGQQQKAIASTGNQNSDLNLLVRLYFPREISQLRAAYQKQSAGQNPANIAPKLILPLDLTPPGSDDDTVPPFSRGQLPLSQQAVLLGIGAELRQHHAQFAILRASDPFDALFLTRFVRSADSEVRVVIVGADRLFAREVQDATLHGVLFLTTYSLVPESSHGFRQSEHDDLVFENSHSAGEYNAMLALLAPLMPEPRQKLSDPLIVKQSSVQLYQYGCKLACSENDRKNGDFPPLHIQVLGHDGFWPVANIGPSTYRGLTYQSKMMIVPNQLDQDESDWEKFQIPLSWKILESLILAGSFTFCAFMYLGSIFSTSGKAAQFAPAFSDWRSMIVAFSGFVLISILLVPLIPLAHHANWGESREVWVWTRLAAVSGVLVLSTTLFDLVARQPRLLEPTSSRSKSPFLVDRHRKVAKWFPVFVFVLFWFCLSVRILSGHSDPANPSEQKPDLGNGSILKFEAIRFMNLASGVSLTLPFVLFLGAGLWWAWHTMAGASLLDSRRPQLPANSDNPRIQPICENGDTVSSLLKLLEPSLSPFWIYLVSVAIVVVAMFFLNGFTRAIRSIDRSRWETVFVVFLCVGFVFLISSTWKMWEIWARARQLLTSLDVLPLRDGFKSLSGLDWSILRWGVTTETEFRRVSARTRDAFAVLKRFDHSLEMEYGQTMQNSMASILSEANVARQTSQWFHPIRRRQLERSLVDKYAAMQKLYAQAAEKALSDLLAEDTHPLLGPSESQKWAEEKFVCQVFTNFLLIVFIRIRMLMLAIAGVYILTVMAISFYPFEPKVALQIAFIVMLAVVIAVAATILGQMHRDPTLSHITNTTPGHLGGDFWVRLISFVSLPLFSLIASQFPEVSNALTSWLEPALQAFK